MATASHPGRPINVRDFITTDGLDPLFKGKKAGAEIPVKITGTYQNPQFGFDVMSKIKPTSISPRYAAVRLYAQTPLQAAPESLSLTVS